MDQAQNRSQSGTNFWIAVVGLGLAGYFVPPPRVYLIFLGAIFLIC